MSANPSQQGWDDYLVSGLSVAKAASLNPTFEQMGATGIYANRYDINDEAWFNIHILHGYKAGSKVYPHVHWSHDGSGVAGDSVIWRITYTPAKGHGQQAFPATTSFDIEATASGTTQMHQIDEASLAQAFNTNLEPDSLILCKIKRISNGGTDCTHKCYVHQIDFHFESDGRLTLDKDHTGGWKKYGG